MIVVAGKNNIAVRAIDYLIKYADDDLAVICTQADNGTDGWQRSLLSFAKKNKVKIIDLTLAYEVSDIFISLEFDKIVKPDLFKKARLYNIHFSDLPKYKGMYTSVFPILNGETIGGVTLHEIDFGIDTGEIIAQINFPIKSNFRARDLYRENITNSFDLFVENLTPILTGEYKKTNQGWANSSYYSKNKLNFSTISIDLNQTCASIIRQIYAYSFREYQLPTIFGKRIVEGFVLDSRSSKKPGLLISEGERSFVISTVDYNLELFFDKVDWISRFADCDVGEASSILKNLAGVNDRNHKGWSPLIVSAYNGNHRVLDFLLDSGALVNDENYNGTSVLMYAKEYALATGDKTSFNKLIKYGANIEKKDFFGRCILDYLSASEIYFLGL